MRGLSVVVRGKPTVHTDRPGGQTPSAMGLLHGRGRKTHGRGQWERLRRPHAPALFL